MEFDKNNHAWKIVSTKELADNHWMVRGELTLIGEGIVISGIASKSNPEAANHAALDNALNIVCYHGM